MSKSMQKQAILTISDKTLSPEDVCRVAGGEYQIKLSEEKRWRKKILDNVNFLESQIDAGATIYGVNTGFGDSCTVNIPSENIHDLPLHLSRYHRCGLGDFFSDSEVRAILVCRLQSLARGYSGVRMELLERFCWFLNNNVLPSIPKEGSVGASGDLTPLAYLAAAALGEGEATVNGSLHSMSEVYETMNLSPLKLKPKESLAIMNGTAVMTALACLALEGAKSLSQWATRLTALQHLALEGNADHFDEDLFDLKPHPGQSRAAERIRKDIGLQYRDAQSGRLQDQYSLRCAPHVIGVLEDALPFFHSVISTELNSSNDNPLIQHEKKKILHGGHFYGGHIAFVMDSLKALVASLADLMDRQTAMMVDDKFNRGLSKNLSGAKENGATHHGLKALQIAISAWTAEALKNCMPVSVFSRSTESHNQDKVSMGTIAARDCLRVLELSEQVAAGTCLTAVQAVDLRACKTNTTIQSFVEQVREVSPFLENDRPLDGELRNLLERMRSRDFGLYTEA